MKDHAQTRTLWEGSKHPDTHSGEEQGQIGVDCFTELLGTLLYVWMVVVLLNFRDAANESDYTDDPLQIS